MNRLHRIFYDLVAVFLLPGKDRKVKSCKIDVIYKNINKTLSKIIKWCICKKIDIKMKIKFNNRE